MQHKNRKNLTKKYRISAVCRNFLNLQVLKTRVDKSISHGGKGSNLFKNCGEKVYFWDTRNREKGRLAKVFWQDTKH